MRVRFFRFNVGIIENYLSNTLEMLEYIGLQNLFCSLNFVGGR
jgi:hypothetical protein